MRCGKKIIIRWAALIMLLFLIAIGVLAWFVYYGPDNTHVAKSSEACRYWHANINPLDLKQVRTFARKYGYNDDYYVVCDFGKRSGLKRFYVYDLGNGKRIMESYCMHGNGNGSTDAVPVFSNRAGSHASSIGLYALCGIGSKNMKTSIKLEGLCRRTAMPARVVFSSTRRGRCFISMDRLNTFRLDGRAWDVS